MLIIWVKRFLNSIETLLWFYLETFIWLNQFLPIIENVLWLEVITLTKISQDFTLIKFSIWWGNKGIDMITHSKI